MATWMTIDEVTAQINRKVMRVQMTLAGVTGAMAGLDYFFTEMYLASIAEGAAAAGLMYNVLQRTRKKYGGGGLMMGTMGLSVAGVQKIYTGISEGRYSQVLVGIAEMALIYVTWKEGVLQNMEYKADQIRAERERLEGEIEAVKTGVVGIGLSVMLGKKKDTHTPPN